MRVISQDGCYDIPYESIILQRLGTSIFGVTTELQESITHIGKCGVQITMGLLALDFRTI